MNLQDIDTRDLLAELDRRYRDAQPPTVIFFGVWPGHDAGHYERLPDSRQTKVTELGRPGCYLYPWDARRDYGRPQPEGKFWHWHHKNKPLTLITSWDRSADRRGNCCAAFLVLASVTPEQALELARANYPKVFERIEGHLGRAVELAGPVED